MSSSSCWVQPSTASAARDRMRSPFCGGRSASPPRHAYTARRTAPVAAASVCAHTSARCDPSLPSLPTRITSPSSTTRSVRTTTTGHDAYSTHSWLTEPRRSPAKPPRPREPSTSTLSEVTVLRSAPAGGPSNTLVVTAVDDPSVSVTIAAVDCWVSCSTSAASVGDRRMGATGISAEVGTIGTVHDWTARAGTPAASAVAAAHCSAIRLWSEPSTPTTNSFIPTPLRDEGDRADGSTGGEFRGRHGALPAHYRDQV